MEENIPPFHQRADTVFPLFFILITLIMVVMRNPYTRTQQDHRSPRLFWFSLVHYDILKKKSNEIEEHILILRVDCDHDLINYVENSIYIPRWVTFEKKTN